MIMTAEVDKKLIMAAYFRGKVDALQDVVVELDEVPPLEIDPAVWQKAIQRINAKLHEALRLSDG